MKSDNVNFKNISKITEQMSQDLLHISPKQLSVNTESKNSSTKSCQD